MVSHIINEGHVPLWVRPAGESAAQYQGHSSGSSHSIKSPTTEAAALKLTSQNGVLAIIVTRINPVGVSLTHGELLQKACVTSDFCFYCKKNHVFKKPMFPLGALSSHQTNSFFFPLWDFKTQDVDLIDNSSNKNRQPHQILQLTEAKIQLQKLLVSFF